MADSTSTAPRDHSALVLAARGGDRAAFGVLYEHYARFVHGVLLAHANRAEVPDLVQDTFLRAMRQLHTLRDAAAFAPWLAALARNEARMRHRAARPTEELTEATLVPAPDASLAEAGAMDMDAVLRALRRLPQRYREPLTLRLVQEMSGERIAERLGLTHGTVRVYLHHGMRLLRESLGATNG